MAEAMRAANGGAEVLRPYGNHGGDNMNFDTPGETLGIEDIASTPVRAADDVVTPRRRR
jgi:dihydroxyacetone kinase-like protein